VIEAIIVAQSDAVSDVSGGGSDAISDFSDDEAEKRSPIAHSIAKPHEREHAFALRNMVRAAGTDEDQHEAMSSIAYDVEVRASRRPFLVFLSHEAMTLCVILEMILEHEVITLYVILEVIKW